MTTVDSTAEEIGTDLEPVAPSPALFKTDDPVEVVERATRVADSLKDVIVNKKLYESIQGKAHVKVEGWQLVGAMLGVTAVCTHTEPVDGGYKATVEARTADGRVVGCADAVCTKHEKRGPWKNADDYARLSMAQTRATSKALKGPLGFVISLAGYQTTPAEEMTFVEPDAPSEPAPAPAKAKSAPAASDVPAPDVWLQDTIATLGDLKLKGAAIRAGLEEIGVKGLPEKPDYMAVLGRLSKDKRLVFSEWLSEQASKGTPLEGMEAAA